MTKQEIIQILAGFVGSFGFACLFNIRGKRLIVTALGGLLSWTLFVLLQHIIPSDPVNYFVVALLLSVYAEVMARIMKTPTTTFITTSLVPLIPGGSLYYTMASVFEGNSAITLDKAVSTMEMAAALALGIIVATTVTRLIQGLPKKSK